MEEHEYNGPFPDPSSAEWLAESLRRLKWELECCQSHWDSALAANNLHADNTQAELANLFMHLHQMRIGAVVTQKWIMEQGLINAALFAEIGRELAQEQFGVPYEVVEVEIGDGIMAFALQPVEVVIPDTLEGMDGEGTESGNG